MQSPAFAGLCGCWALSFGVQSLHSYAQRRENTARGVGRVASCNGVHTAYLCFHLAVPVRAGEDVFLPCRGGDRIRSRRAPVPCGVCARRGKRSGLVVEPVAGAPCVLQRPPFSRHHHIGSFRGCKRGACAERVPRLLRWRGARRGLLECFPLLSLSRARAPVFPCSGLGDFRRHLAWRRGGRNALCMAPVLEHNGVPVRAQSPVPTRFMDGESRLSRGISHHLARACAVPV